MRRMTHKTIAAVTDDIDKFRFNRAVARMHELTNALEELPVEAPDAGAVLREGLETLTRLLGPMMPHLAEEMWQELGHPNPGRRDAVAASGCRPRPRRAGDDRGAGQRQVAGDARPSARRGRE